MIVLIKGEIGAGTALDILEAYGWEVETELLSKEESVQGDTIYLCVRKE